MMSLLIKVEYWFKMAINHSVFQCSQINLYFIVFGDDLTRTSFYSTHFYFRHELQLTINFKLRGCINYYKLGKLFQSFLHVPFFPCKFFMYWFSVKQYLVWRYTHRWICRYMASTLQGIRLNLLHWLSHFLFEYLSLNFCHLYCKHFLWQLTL